MTTQVAVFTGPGCQACVLTRRWLSDRGIAYIELDPTIPAYAERLRDAGYTQLPIVEVVRPDGGTASWDGFRPSQLEAVFGGAQ